jgi:hypothetical protein
MKRYDDRTMSELRRVAKKKGLSGYSKLRKMDLIKYIRSGKSKYERCVLSAKKRSNVNPWAVCWYLR